MEEIVHLVDAEELGACAAHAIFSLDRDGPGESRIILIGRGERIERAERLGVRADLRILVPANHARTVKSRLKGRVERATLVHAWSIDAACVGRLLFPESPLVVSLGWAPVDVGLLSRIPKIGGVTVPDESTHRACARMGYDGSEVVRWAWSRREDSRERLRRRFGIQDDELVLMVLGEPTREIDAKTATYQAGVASVVGSRMVALIPEDARDVARALRFTLLHHGAWRVILSRLDPLEILDCADIVLVQTKRKTPRDGHSLRPIACHACVERCVGLGIPIVAAEDAELKSLVGDGRAVFATDNSPLALNRAIHSILHGKRGVERDVRPRPARTCEEYVQDMMECYKRAITRATANRPGAPIGTS